MKSRFFSNLAVGLTVLLCALSFSSAKAQAGCTYTCVITDSWGDGWNGTTSVLIQRAGLPDTVITGPATFGPETVTFFAYQGSLITFSGIGGSGAPNYSDEADIAITDPQGNSLGSFNGATWTASPGTTFLTVNSSNSTCPPPSCAAPTSPLVFGITPSTVDYSFTDGNGAPEFEVSYGATGFTAGAGTEFIATSTNTGLSGLTAQTSYDVYVRAICAVGDTSPWSAVSSFTTLCNVFAVPYTQDFTTFLPDACWDEATSGTPATGPSGFGTGSWRASGGAVRLNSYSNFLEDWVLTPSFDLGTGTAYQASFDFAIYSWNGTAGATCGSDDEFQFLISTDGGTTWTPLFTADVSYGSTGLTSQAIDLSSYSGVVQFAFYGTDGVVDDAPDVDFFFDNFVIDELPACQAVASLSTSNLSSSSVDLSFTDLNSGALGYIVSYTDGTTIDTISPNPTTTSVSISGLTASTSYTFSIEALCSSGDTSGAATISATTYGDCSSSGTYAYGPFSSIAGAQTFVANTPGDWINLNFSAGATEACCDDWFITDGPNGTGNVIANGRGSLVGSYESQTGTISFYVVSDGSVNGTAFQYSLSCNPPVTCFPVRDLAAANVTASSADISWTDSASNAGTSEWEVSYGVSGFPVGSGTEVFVSTASASLSGLSAAVNYDVYVRAVCGAGDTSAWRQVSFQTACPVYATPYSMTFDLASTPLCWTNTGVETWQWQTASGSGASTYAVTPGGGDNTGNGGAFAALDGSGTNPSSPNLATLTSPSIDLSGLTTPRLRFYVFSNNTTAPGDNATFYAIVAGTTDTLVSYAGDDASWVELTADLSAYAGQTIAIEISGNHQTMTGSQFYNDLLVDDFFVEETPSCLSPSALAFSNITETSADVSWTDNNTPASSLFEVSIGASGFTAGNGTQTFVNSASESFSGLAENTTYNVYVRANCGVNSAWSTVGSFTTLRFPPAVAQGVTCTSGGNASIVFSESFETALTGWSGDIGTANGTWECPDGATSANTGANDGYNVGNFMNYEASATTANQGTIVSPAIDLSGGADDAELSFWMHAYGADMGTLNVGVGSTATGPFTNLFEWTGQFQTSGADAWVNVGVDLSAYVGSTIYIAFTQYDTVTGNQFAGDMSIDEMTVTTCIACAAPSALTASNVAATSADLAWTENGSATEWEVSYGAAGFTAGSGTEVSASATSLSLTGLTAQTSYNVYVRSVCGVGDTSDWSGVASFTTPCLSEAVPYSQDFTTFLPNACWDEATSGTPATGPSGFGTGNWRSSGGAVRLNVYLNNVEDWVLTPSFDLGTGTAYQATFDFAIYSWNGTTPTAPGSDDEFQFLISTDLGATWTSLYTADVSYGTTGLSNQVIDLTSYSGVVQFAFYGTDGAVNDLPDVDFYFDNFVIEEIPNCQDVQSLTATATSSTSIEVSFVDPNSTAPSNGYVVTYDDGSGAQTVSPNPTASPFTISGLTAATSYTITVQADCGGGSLSPSAVSVTESTTCDVFAAPYSEDFDLNSTLPICWSQETSDDFDWSVGSGGTPSTGTGPTDDLTGGGNYLFIEATGPVSGATASVLSPTFDLSSLTTPQLVFSTHMSGTAMGALDVYISTDAGATFIQVFGQNGDQGTSWVEQTVALSTYAGSTSAIFKFVATRGTSFTSDIAIDGFSIEETPTCLVPTALSASATSSSTADVSWTDPNSATEWEVSYGATGFTAGAGTEVSATSASATLSGLTAETGYDVYVRAICAVGDTSDWSAVASFTTPCAAIVPAYLEDFTAGYQPTSCWSQGEGGSPTAGPASTGFSGWNTDGLANAGTTGAARINIYGSSGTDWLITPSFDLSSGGPWEASFDVAVVNWNQTTPSFLDANNDFGLYASTDGGSTWTAIWSADENYVTNPGGNNETVDLSAYTGTVQFAFYAASNFGAADNDVSIDNFAISLVNSNYTWSGASGTAWEVGANWAGGVAPQAITDVVIVPSVTNQPVITALQSVGDLTVADNVTVTLNTGGELLVNGNLNLGSAASLTGDGSVNLTGGNSGTDLVINGAATIENLEISSNYSLTSGILNITGGLFLDGGDFTGGINVVLNSNANGTAYLDDFSGSGGTYNGQITCQLYVPGTTGVQHFISSPVSTPNLTELADDLSGYGAGLTGTNGVAVTPTATCDPNALDPSSNYGNMFEWSASTAQNIACPQQGGWIVRSAGTMDNARGYSAYLTGAGATLDMSGTPNTGDVTINMASLAITNNTAMSNWDILGNPYPSGLDRNALITGNNTGTGLNSISYWNPSGTYSGTYAPYLPGDVIASFQGFSANWDGAGTSPVITFSNSMRSTATGTWRTGWYNERIDVELRGNGFADRTIILFADDATNGFDAMYDAEKFASASGQPTLYTGSTEHYALNSLAADAYGQSIPMGVVAGADGYFEFDFSTVENLPNGSMLYLEDLATGTWTNVSENPVYGFNMLATDASDRFILHFTPEVTATAVDGTCENADAYIELTFDGYQIAGQDVAWNYAVSTEGMAQAQGSMVSTIAIPVSESGIYNVDFTFGNATVNEVLSINVPIAPTAAIPAEVALSENEAITLNGMFTNANSYEWAVDGVVFSTEANPTWTASTEGIYNIAVTVRSEDGCSASDNMVAEVSKSVTSINDVNAVFQITQDAYSVVVLTDAEGFMIEMIAMDGKLVASALANQGANVLSTQALASGVYEVRLSSANGVVGSQKVLVK